MAITTDLSQCQTCRNYYKTQTGHSMCREVGDDFYLMWKQEHCPEYSSGSYHDEVKRLSYQNAALREQNDLLNEELKKYRGI